MIKILHCHPLIIHTYLANILAHCLRWLKLIFGQQLIIIAFLTIFICSYNPATVFAVEDEGVKNIINNDGDGCINGSDCQVERFATSGEKSKAVTVGHDWEVDNRFCAAVAASAYGVQFVLASTADILCQGAIAPTTYSLKSIFLTGIGISPVAYSSWKVQFLACKAQIAASAADPTGAAGTAAINCCVAAASFLTSILSFIATNGIVYAISEDAYQNNVMCGNNWLSWSNKSNDNKFKTCRQGAYEGSFKKKLDDCFGEKTSNSCGDQKIANENYRSFIYGGVEYEDNRSDACKNPANWSSSKRMAKLGYDSDNQRYYFTGPGQMPVFACYRFYSPDKTDSDIQEAYNCCKKASQNLTCIAKNSTSESYSTCIVGEECSLAAIKYYVEKSTVSPNRICVSTYSLCPSNHKLGGGTEKKSYIGTGSSLQPQVLSNYCQYLKHCTIIPPQPYVNDIISPDSFVSQSCRDMQGDTQNKDPFTIKFLKGKNFSAPLVQCFKETTENIFFNRAGYSKCLDTNEEPSKDVCKSGYQFKKGDPLTKDSVFIKISNIFRDLVRIMLALSVVFMGMRILLGTQPEKKLLLLYVAKIGLIIYFVLGDAWQTMFMKGVFALSETLVDITMQIRESDDPTKLDGCQFPRFNYLQEDNLDNPKYPPGKEYLRVWDTLDCKLAKAIGFGPEVTVPNLIKIILPAIFSSFLAVGGIFFVFAVVFFGLLFFSIVIRAVQISITSTIAIVLLVYISPLAIVAGFFEKTKEAFNSWLSQLLGMALQPMIIFAYIGVFVTVFDSIVVGKDVSFVKSGQDNVAIVCGDEAKKTSIYCMFDFVKFSESLDDSSASAMLGLPGFWILQDVLGDSFSKSIQLFKCLLILFVFFNAFDHIPSLAVALVGGIKINAKNEIDSMGIAKKVGGGIFAVAKLGSFAATKGLQKAGDTFGQMRTPLPKNGGDKKEDASDSKSDSKSGGNSSGDSGSRDSDASFSSSESGNRSSSSQADKRGGDSQSFSSSESGEGEAPSASGSGSKVSSSESSQSDTSNKNSSPSENRANRTSNNISQDSADVSSSDESRIELQVNPPVNQSVAQAEKGAPESKDGKSLIGSGGSSDGASKPSDNSNNSSSKEGLPSQQSNNKNSSNLQGGLLEGRDGDQDSVNREDSNYEDADDKKFNKEEDFLDIDEKLGEDGDSSNKPEESGEEEVDEDDAENGSKNNIDSEEEKLDVPEELKSEEKEPKPNEQQDAIIQNSNQVEAPKQELNNATSNPRKPSNYKPPQAESRYSNEKRFNNFYRNKQTKIDNALKGYFKTGAKDDTFKEVENLKSSNQKILKDKTGTKEDRKIALESLKKINEVVDTNLKSGNGNYKERAESLKTDERELDEARKELYK